MCVDESPQHNPHQLLHDVGPVEVVTLEPVDTVTVTTLMDNSLDLFMPDQGPAHRVGPDRWPARPCSVMTDREVPDALIAEHGFSMLVTISKAGREHRMLFDAGTSPDGVVENMRRLDIDPSSIEAIVCSHGHFDHHRPGRTAPRPRTGRHAGAHPSTFLAPSPRGTART